MILPLEVLNSGGEDSNCRLKIGLSLLVVAVESFSQAEFIFSFCDGPEKRELQDSFRLAVKRKEIFSAPMSAHYTNKLPAIRRKTFLSLLQAGCKVLDGLTVIPVLHGDFSQGKKRITKLHLNFFAINLL